jgi:malonyl-CoA/methylmalonyl-CoA synthetase
MQVDLIDAMAAAARAMPDQPFLTDPGGKVTAYAAALGRAGQYAAALGDLGVGKGDRVALQVEKTPEAIYLYLGCLRLGAVFLPLNPSYTPAETGYFLTDAETSLYLCDPARLATHDKGLPGRTLAFAGDASLSTLADAAAARAPDPNHRPDDLAAILYTSGTTGRSKGVMLTRANLASNAHALRHAWAFTPRDVVLHALPIFHTHGLFVATNTAIVCGASLLFLPDFKPAAVLAALPAATVMMGVPTHYTRLLADPGLTRAACAHMRLFISGSAPLSAVTHQEWRDRTGHAILERYGMTETNMLTSNPYEGERRAGTVGMALPGVEVRVADPTTGASLPGGEVGWIEVKGPNVFQGYWRAPEKTAAEFRADGFFITGDMGMVDADGYLHIVGRAKDMVITGGLNVYPAEVEAALDALPGVAASAVIGVPHPDFGEAVVALVIPRPGVQLSGDDLRAALRATLAGYKLPKAVVMEAEFPRNAMGKVQKNVLRERFREMFTGIAG